MSSVGAIDARERLVEQQQLGVLCGDLREQGALALAARQLAEPAAREVVDGERAHRVRHELAVAVRHPPPPAERAPAAHRDDVADGRGEHRLDRDLLGEVGDAVGADRRSRPRAGSRQPDGGREQRALPRPVRPEHGDRAPARHLEVDRLERDDVAVTDGQVLARQDRAHGASAPAIRSAS